MFKPKAYARTGGFVYLVIIVAGFLGEMFVRNAVIVSGNPAATAANLNASIGLWRLGIAGDLVMHIGDVILMMIFYTLMKPVNKHLALLALLFNIMQTAVLVANKLNLLTPLFLLDSTPYLGGMDIAQRQVLAYVAIKMHGYGFGVGLIFFGFTCLILGYLIIRSTFLPRWIGLLIQLAGICYLINSFSLILAPDLAGRLFPFIMLPPFIGELSLCLWLLIKGVNVERWNAVAMAASSSNK